MTVFICLNRSFCVLLLGVYTDRRGPGLGMRDLSSFSYFLGNCSMLWSKGQILIRIIIHRNVLFSRRMWTFHPFRLLSFLNHAVSGGKFSPVATGLGQMWCCGQNLLVFGVAGWYLFHFWEVLHRAWESPVRRSVLYPMDSVDTLVCSHPG